MYGNELGTHMAILETRAKVHMYSGHFGRENCRTGANF
jgi:hypothetical protein